MLKQRDDLKQEGEINLDEAVKDPEILDKIVEMMLPHASGAQIIVGPSGNGEIIAKALAEKLRVRYAVYTKTPGIKGEGHVIDATCFLVNDILDLGILDKAAKAVNLCGGSIYGGMTVVSNHNYGSLLSPKELK